MGNTAQHCGLGLFQDSDFLGDLEDSQSTSRGILCIFGSRTFVRVSWIFKKQTAVSHSSTESEIISLDAGLRVDGSLALGLRDTVIEVLRSTDNNVQPKHMSMHATLHSKAKTQKVKRRQKVHQLSDVDHVPNNTHSSHNESQLYIFEDNEAVIKMTSKGRSQAMRHVSGTHKVSLDWLFDRINLEPQIRIKCDNTKTNSLTF